MPKRLRNFAALLLAITSVSLLVGWQLAGSQPKSAKTEPLASVVSGPRYWKGNLHTHSLWSDGNDFPEMIADWYKQHGYNFLTLSDHNILSEGERWIDIKSAKTNREVAVKKYLDRFGPGWVERRMKDAKTQQVRLKPLAEFRSTLEEAGKFLLIPGEEITHKYAKNPVHMNAINLRDVILPANGKSVSETIVVNMRAVREQRKKKGMNTIVFLNHPNFGWGVKAEDMLSEELRFFEVFNGHPGVKNQGDATHVSCEKMWDIVLALRLGKEKLPIVYGMATDDAHDYHTIGLGKTNPGRGWIMVKTPFLTAESMCLAMEAGDYYCTSGVVLKDVHRSAKKLSLAIQAEKGVKYKTQFIATMKDTPLASSPKTDAAGKPLDVTRDYHADLGKVIAESDSLEPSYQLTGNELYVRAKVISTKLHPNPYQKGDVEVAWTQPATP